MNEKLQLNKCVVALSLDLLSRYFNTLLDNGYPIISVGSGIGTVERYLHPEDKVVCVDPDPFSYQIDMRRATCKIHGSHSEYDSLMHLPNYSRISEEWCSDYTGKSNIFINWPSSSITGIEDNYDIDAITILKPVLVLITLERTGGTGSQKLLGSLMRFLDIGHTNYIQEKYRNSKALSDYVLEYSTTAVDRHYDEYDRLYTYVLLRRTDTPPVFLNVPEEVDADSYFLESSKNKIDLDFLDQGECVLM